MLALLLRSTQTRAFHGDLLRAYSTDPLKYAFPENEGDEIRRRRLAWHSTKRGMVETELILGSFAKLNLATMSSKELDAYDHILQEADPDIFNWITGKETPKEEFLSLNPVIEDLLTRIRKHATVGRTANVQQL